MAGDARIGMTYISWRRGAGNGTSSVACGGSEIIAVAIHRGDREPSNVTAAWRQRALSSIGSP